MSGRGGIGLAHDAEVYDLTAARDAGGGARGGWDFRGHTVGPRRYPRPAFDTRRPPRFGFWARWEHTPSVVRRELILPYWVPAVVMGILPTLWLVRRRTEARRRRRAEAGLCVKCGYDLRAGGATCPECGSAAAPRPAAGNTPS